MRPRSDLAAFCVFGCISLVMLVLLGRVVQLQASPPPRLQPHIGERVSKTVDPGPRGDILDRRGRLLATSRFGYRAVVDPALFPNPPHEKISELAAIIREPEEKVGAAILPRMIENERRLAEAAASVAPGASPSPRVALKRYAPVSGVLDDDRVEALRLARIPGVSLEIRTVREPVAGRYVASLLGTVGFEGQGMMGAEQLLNADVAPTAGLLSIVRDSAGRALWIDPEAFSVPRRGHDVRLSLDLELQRICSEELIRGMEEADAQGGRVILFDPNTGEVLAMCDLIRDVPGLVDFRWQANPGAPDKPRYRTIRPDPARTIHPALGRNRCIEDLYEPGSTFKPFMWSVVTERGLARPDEVFVTHGGKWHTPYGRLIEDVVERASMTWREVLINSSNIGMVKATTRLNPRQMHDAVRRFGFGKRTAIGLRGESPGRVTPLSAWNKYTHTSVASGYEVGVTPLQMVRAFSSFCRGQIDARPASASLNGTLPTAHIRAAESDSGELSLNVRVLPREIADLTRSTLRGVTHKVDQRLQRMGETNFQYELFGKSGTAKISAGSPGKGKRRPRGWSGYFARQYNTSFIAGGPYADPRLVCLVVIDDPGPELVRKKEYYGSYTAGPVVRRIMERSLAYLGVKPSPPPPDLPIGN